MDFKIGKRYCFKTTYPSNKPNKSGLLVNVDDRNIATLMCKNGEIWYVPTAILKPFKN